MSYTPKYTSIQEVRYSTRLLTTDDMSDEEVTQHIRAAEAEIESWAKRDGVESATWSPVPTLVDLASMYKASQIALASKKHDGRLASSESRSGSSMTINPDTGPAFYEKKAEKAWQDYLATVSQHTARARAYTPEPVIGYFNEDTWRQTGEENE